MTNEISLKVGEMVAVKGSYHIKSIGIGSCVVIVMHDKENKIAAVTHSMLPSAYEGSDSQGEGRLLDGIQYYDSKYIDETMPRMLDLMLKLGANKKDITLKIAGGAIMFKSFKSEGVTVGEKNIEMAKRMAVDLGLTITSDDTGGNHGRSVVFNTSNGVLNVNSRI